MLNTPPQTFLTGRTRTLTFTKKFTSSGWTLWYGGGDPTSNGFSAINRCLLGWNIAQNPDGTALLALAGGNPGITPGPKGGVPGNTLFTGAYASVTSTDLFNAPDAVILALDQNATYGATLSPGPTVQTVSGSTNGTHSIQVSAQEWCLIRTPALEFESLAQGVILGGQQFPDYEAMFSSGGAGIADGVPQVSCQFLETLVPGSQVTVTAEVNGTTATCNYTVPAPPSGSLPPVITYLSLNFDESVVDGTTVNAAESANLSANLDLNQVPVTDSWTASGSGGSVSFTSSISTQAACSAGAQGYAALSFAKAPDTQYQISGRIRSFQDAGPSIAVDYWSGFDGDGNPRFTGLPANLQATVAQPYSNPSLPLTNPMMGSSTSGFLTGVAAYNVGTDVNSNFTIPEVNQLVPMRAWLDRTSLSGSGDDLRDWRVQWRGKPFPSFTLSQAPNLVVATGSVTVPGGGASPISLAVTNWQGYRYLAFTADQPGTFRVTNPFGGWKDFTFAVATPGTSQTVTVDLCSPSGWDFLSGLPNVDARQSSYPDENQSDPLLRGAYWGIFMVASLTLTSLSPSAPLNCGPLSLTGNSASATFLPKFLPTSPGTSDGINFQPFAFLMSDERLCIDAPAMAQSPYPTGPISYFSISDLIATLNGVPGWHAAAASSFPDPQWNNNNGYAAWAFGSGAVHENGSWTDGVDVGLGLGIQITAQALFDDVQGYPGIGDPFNQTGYPASNESSAFPVWFSKSIRGRNNGFCFKPSGEPATGGLVITTDLTKQIPSGTGTAGANAYYVTGLPGQISPDSIQATSGASRSTSVRLNRESSRLSLKIQLPGSNSPALLARRDGYFAVAYLGPNSSLEIAYGQLAAPVNLTQVQIDPRQWAYPSLAMDDANRVNVAAVLKTNGKPDGWYRFNSLDYGDSWPDPELLLMNATQGRIAESLDATRLTMAFIPDSSSSPDGPGTFQVQSEAAGAIGPSLFATPVDGSGNALRSDGSGFDVIAGADQVGRWWLTFVVVGETALSHWFSLDLGLTWTRI